jgi:hypothetical protein
MMLWVSAEQQFPTPAMATRILPIKNSLKNQYLYALY